MARQPSKFGPRIRFNWGYHDARSDRALNLDRQQDRPADRPLPASDTPYCAGYAAGMVSLTSETLSEEAWKAYSASPVSLNVWRQLCQRLFQDRCEEAEQFGL